MLESRIQLFSRYLGRYINILIKTYYRVNPPILPPGLIKEFFFMNKYKKYKYNY